MGKFTMKQIMITFVISFVIIGFYSQTAQAKSIQDYEKEIKELEDESGKLNSEKNKIKKDKDEVKSDMDENLESQSTVEEQMEKIESDLDSTEADINDKENEIATTNKEIKKLNEEIATLKSEIKTLQERIEKREELLMDRLRAIQESGGNVQYLAVILGSENFSDLITRSSAVNSIMDQDKSIMEEHVADKKSLETKEKEQKEKKQSVEEKKAEQEEQKEQLVSLKSQLDNQKSEKKKLQKKLAKEYDQLEEASLSLEEEQALIASQEEVLAQAKQEASSKKADLEAEEERKRKEAEAARQAQQSSGSSGSSKGTNNSGPQMNTGNGSFIWPTVSGSRSSSPYGSRIHPISGQPKMHYGLDIAPPSKGQKVPIYAVDSGIVTYAGGLGSYGNVVMISHGELTTLYAHLDSISVSKGQSVSQGSQIGRMGTTGGSTGVHLHFEVHPGGYRNPVNPVGYLP